MLLLLVPALQRRFQFISEASFALVKVPDASALPEPTFKAFLESSYQDSVVSWFNATAGFRPLLVRLRNQIDYSCFHLAHGTTVYGKGGYLFLDESMKSFIGQTFDSALLCRRTDTIVMLRKYLAARNIPLLYVMAPGKTSFDRVYLPDEYKALRKNITGYELLGNRLEAHQVDYINLSSYFDKIAATSSYPLFPKQGLHWTTYGAAVALDTIYKKVTSILQFAPLKIDLSHVTISSEPKYPDDDLAVAMNIFRIRPMDTLATPVPVWINAKSAEIRKPKILFIGDSYTFVFGFTKLPTQIFDSTSRYWFYMRSEKSFSDIMKEGNDLATIDLKNALGQFDLVIILSTDARYDYGDYGLYTRLINDKAIQ